MVKVFYMISVYPENVKNNNISPIEKFTFSIEDEEFDIDEFEDFDDYIEYKLDESVAEIEQHFGNAIVITEEQLKLIQNFKL